MTWFIPQTTLIEIQGQIIGGGGSMGGGSMVSVRA